MGIGKTEMQDHSEKDSGGREWHPAPWQSAPMTSGTIQGVWLSPNEEVEWTWETSPFDGTSRIVGYTLKNKPLPPLNKSDL